MTTQSKTLACVAMMTISSAASAHTGVHEAHGLLHGFAHPIGGLDHVLAMVAVGLFAAHLGGRALWMVPATFVLTMVLGAGWALTGFELPFVEAGIALSVVTLGLALALGHNLPTGTAAAVVAAFAGFHGYAHGAEIPSEVSGFTYGVGFVVATMLLHLAGVTLWLVAARIADRAAMRLGGAAIAVAGAMIFSGYL